MESGQGAPSRRDHQSTRGRRAGYPDRRKRLEKQIESQARVVTDLYTALKEARTAEKKAEERRARQDGQVAKELFADTPDLDIVCARVETVIGERDRLAEANAAAATAEATHRAAVAKLAALRAELPKLNEKAALLESRREIFQADVEQDRIFSVYKLAFVLLCELALREFFEGLNISLATFMRQILNLPFPLCFQRLAGTNGAVFHGIH